MVDLLYIAIRPLFICTMFEPENKARRSFKSMDSILHISGVSSAIRWNILTQVHKYRCRPE
ncbi:hypothetical protein CW304_12025 [Bacillus sp. UFRGS-B20]|nr:hypothetical protein CW304_12025 [Bacillus sp. UFRGS-B20]